MGTSKDILIDEIFEIKEEKDMLAEENKNFAEFLKKLGYSQNEIDNIAAGGFKEIK
jgi:hypothetical protein